MSERCQSCGSCGMAMRLVEDFGGAHRGNRYCVHCSDREGNLAVTYERVVSYFAEDFEKRRGLNPTRARELAEACVSALPAWSSR
ncbi:zinc ribbon domain-containing protein [Pelagicoccus sp. SDUM812003]|uniref:zinc ribbon domain-containing protein n=1 Tax=Pelagicoccus sp. SDUM812003 TaxID=3041267 RepID=UPI00280FB596|nr:zinc ribbon domain-containing protein [Pelagicoccus sp. SDUM812003]MDQ8204366.1 zinc ribbon domain-containing protein [Pelagicoccus sp. SDUM812003]